jgi:uncharacterized protein
MKAVKATIVALALCCGFAAAAEVAVPLLSGRVVDQTSTLTGDQKASLDQTLKDLEARKGSQVAVLIVPTTQSEAIEQYSIRVAEAWKIGRKKIDDGALLVIAKDDHKLRIEVGYGLEGALNDVTAKRIIDEVITPKFRSGDFAGGISAGIDRMIGVIDGEPLPVPAAAPSQQLNFAWVNDINPGFALFGIIFMGGILRALLGRLIGAAATGGIVGLVAWFLAASMVASLFAGIIVFVIALVIDLTSPQGSSRSGGWSGGGASGGSWSGSGGSSDSGGFSGGGGSFGGGGASGSW